MRPTAPAPQPKPGVNGGVPATVDTPHLSAAAGSVTALLIAWHDGDEAALLRLTPLVHRELQRIARRCMRGERAGHSLQATALVNEAYIRLVDVRKVNWRSRAHFLAMSARSCAAFW
jgi:hypothetical protein